MPSTRAIVHAHAMTGLNIDSEATTLLRRAGYEEDDVPGAVAVAARLDVPVRSVEPKWLRGLDAALVRIHGRPHIFLRKGLSSIRTHWCVAHELGELRLAEIGYQGADIESRAHRIAAGLMMPRRAFEAAFAEHGLNIGALSKDFLCDQTATALRIAEVEKATTVYVVAPTHIRVSGTTARAPSPSHLRRLAQADSAGLRRIPLTDAKNRVALVA